MNPNKKSKQSAPYWQKFVVNSLSLYYFFIVKFN